MTVLPSGSHTPAGIDASLDASRVTQKMRAARRSRYQALRSRHQPKSTNQSSEVKITGDRHAANPRCHEGLGNRDVCSTLRPTHIRVGNRLVDQAPESIEAERSSGQTQRFAEAAPLCFLAHGHHRPFLAVRPPQARSGAKSTNPMSGAVMGIDPPRSQAPPRSDGWDKDDDDRRSQTSHAPDEEGGCPLCEDTTVGEGCDGCRVPRCPWHDRGQGGSGLAATGEAHEAHAEA
jgi:hypothetical protein